MEKIASFTVDHLKLKPGIYVSRKDHAGNTTLTTFDIRMTSPNDEPVLNTAEIHTIEHLGATYLRNDPDWKENVIYFGPMGCRTGFYLIWLATWNPRTLSNSSAPFSPGSPLSRAMSLARVRKTAATISI